MADGIRPKEDVAPGGINSSNERLDKLRPIETAATAIRAASKRHGMRLSQCPVAAVSSNAKPAAIRTARLDAGA
jgi:hypothetical protein